jgi:tripartite-type tricarboxylate transporter receptor subunit TctC
MINRRDALLLGSGCLPGVIARGAIAQSRYPQRPIRLVVPAAPGGAADVIGRHWAEEMKARLGPVFIEDLGGGGGSIGAAAVARADADGYSILVGSAGVLILIPLASHARYDLARDFAPISILGVVPIALVIHPSLPVRNLNELVDYAKANPGKLSYGSSGAGTVTNLTGELFKSLTGTPDIVHVPYKGPAQSIADLISRQVQMVTLNFSSQALQLHRSASVRMLAVTTPSRLAAAPDIPTAVEQGLPGMIAQNFYGLFAPAGTPTAIVEQISEATRTALADDKFHEKLIASGFEPYLDSSTEAARRFVNDEIIRWTPIIKAIRLKLGMRGGNST